MGTIVSDLSSSTTENNQAQLVVFTLAGCRFAVGIRQAREIIRISDITVMPKTPKFLQGIIHLRGRITPVLDLKKRFGMPLLEVTQESRILVVEWKDQVLGLLVDKVQEVGRASREDFLVLKESVLDIEQSFLSGTVRLKEHSVLLLNLEKVFGLDGWKDMRDMESGSAEE